MNNDWYGTPGNFCFEPDPEHGTQCLGKPGHDGEHQSLSEVWT